MVDAFFIQIIPMNKFFLIIIVVFGVSCAKAEKLDTLYFDEEGKGMGSVIGASFYRITYTPSDSNFVKTFNEYYVTGELKSKGRFLSFDKYDDSKFVRDGEVEWYYKSGIIEQKASYKSGKIVGTINRFSEDGTIRHEIFPEEQYFVVYRNNESFGKYNIENGKPIYITPLESDIKEVPYKNIMYKVYNKNGIKLSMGCENVKEYGKYYRLHLFITSMSHSVIDFSTDDIIVEVTKNASIRCPLRVYTSDEYEKKINKKNARKKWWNKMNEQSNAAKAGTKIVSSQTYGNIANNTSSNTNVNVYGGNASNMYGNISSSQKESAYGNVYSNVTIKDNAAAYEAQQVAQRNIEEYNMNLDNKKRELLDEYLEDCKIESNSVIGGYVNVEKEIGRELRIKVKINGTIYPFTFNLE